MGQRYKNRGEDMESTRFSVGQVFLSLLSCFFVFTNPTVHTIILIKNLSSKNFATLSLSKNTCTIKRRKRKETNDKSNGSENCRNVRITDTRLYIKGEKKCRSSVFYTLKP